MGAGDPPTTQVEVKPKWFFDLTSTFIGFALISCTIPSGLTLTREMLFWIGNAFVFKWFHARVSRNFTEAQHFSFLWRAAVIFMILPGHILVFSALTFASALVIARRAFPSYSDFFRALFSYFSEEYKARS